VIKMVAEGRITGILWRADLLLQIEQTLSLAGAENVRPIFWRTFSWPARITGRVGLRDPMPIVVGSVAFFDKLLAEDWETIRTTSHLVSHLFPTHPSFSGGVSDGRDGGWPARGGNGGMCEAQ
jgi:hypothetical protein